MNNQNQPGQDHMAEGFFRLLIGALCLIVSPFVIVSTLLGYLLRSAWQDKKYQGVLCVLFIAAAINLYLVGWPKEILFDSKNHYIEFFPGTLFTELQNSFVSFYQSLYSLIHAKISAQSYVKFQQLLRYVLWCTIPGGLAVWGFLDSRKDWKTNLGLYNLFKAPLSFWLHWVSSPEIDLAPKLFILSIQCALIKVPAFFTSGIYYNLAFFLIGITATTGLIAIFQSTKRPAPENPDRIRVDEGETFLSSMQLNHHVHVLGESGFGKSVFLMQLISHHIRNGMGLIFIDLKADTDTVNEITTLCTKHNRTRDLLLFDCSRPEISMPYNVLLKGNPTEIKDKLIGSFFWENSYYKDAAQSFLLTVTKALVFLRDSKKMSFSLEDLYQATLSPDALIALQAELKDAPEDLREDINGLAHYLRNRENFKELHGLRTQIKLLIDTEFGKLLTSTTPGIDLFDAIKSHKIVYILLDSQRYGESAKKLGKLILQDLKAASAKIIAEIPKSKRSPCTIIVDEFSDLATEQFVGLLNRARGSGLGIVIAHQEMSDLEALSTTMRDQIMGNTATTVSFLQKMPESAERLSAIIGTKHAIKTTRQVNQEGFLNTRQYTGQQSEREVEEFIVHPNEFKNLTVGEAIIIGKYPKAWTKRIKVPRPNTTSMDPGAVMKILESLPSSLKSPTNQPLALREKVRALHSKAENPGDADDSAGGVELQKASSDDDPNF